MHRINHRLGSAIARALLAGGALGLALPALAAEQGPGDAGKAEVAGQAVNADSPQDTKGTKAEAQAAKDKQVTQLAGMVVTAQSRKQEVEDVPIAVDIVDAANIQTHAATDLSKMDIFVPGLVVSAEQPTQPSYQLRGIGGSGFGVGTDSAVGVYIDGVYAARSGGALMAFNDVKRIEVLKGPQGTLFGRNAAAGAISIVTNRPSDHFEGRARVRLGNYGQRYGDFLLNLPAGKNMAFRLSAVDNQSHGWAEDAATGRHYKKDDDWGARASWLWNVSKNTQVWLTWDHERLDQPPQPAFGLVALSSDPQQRPPAPPDPSTYLNPLHAPLYNDAVGAAETRRFDGVTLNIDQGLPFGSLTSITAFRRFNTLNRGDYDGTNHIVSYLDTANIESNRSWYQEFKLSGYTDRVDWVAGASYYSEDARQTSQTNVFTDSVDTLAINTGADTGTPDGTIYHYFNSLLQLFNLPYNLLGDPWREEIQNHGRYKSYAVYGDVIWHLTDRLNLTTGLRYTRDRKDFAWYNPPRYAPELDETIDALDAMGLLALAGVSPSDFRQNLIFNAASGDPVGVHISEKRAWTDVSPRVVLDYHFTPTIMGFASVAKGYKAGGFNSVQISSEFEPEKVWNYEAGVKSVFPDQRLVVNASIYHYRYSNLQSLTLDPNTTGSGVPRYLVDSSNETADGVDLEVQWQPVDGLTLHGTGAYIDSRYGNKRAASGADLSGQPTGIPKFSFAVGLQYQWAAMGGRMTFDLNHAYRGQSRCNRDSQLQGTCQISPNFDVGSEQQRTDMRLDWNGAHFGVALFVNNLFDKRYVNGVNNISTSVLGTPFASISPPRMYGVELRANF